MPWKIVETTELDAITDAELIGIGILIANSPDVCYGSDITAKIRPMVETALDRESRS